MLFSAARMRVIALRTLKTFLDSKSEFADAREPILAWYQQVRKADWATPADVKRDIGNASILKDVGWSSMEILSYVST
jgi:mRNA interferase HigB